MPTRHELEDVGRKYGLLLLERGTLCNFCRKRREHVRLLISAPTGECICDECIDLAAKIVAEETAG